MEKFWTFFAYIYYRAYRFAKKRTDGAEIYGIGIVTTIQYLILFSLIMVIRLIFGFEAMSTIYFLPLLLGIGATNLVRYFSGTRKINFDSLWAEESSTQRKLRGWLIVALLVSVIILPQLLGELIFIHNR